MTKLTGGAKIKKFTVQKKPNKKGLTVKMDAVFDVEGDVDINEIDQFFNQLILEAKRALAEMSLKNNIIA
ncbi:MAG: hypothetical protein ACTSYD_08165 [Candidatus Heimdallarchaeaceae archaeon]